MIFERHKMYERRVQPTSHITKDYNEPPKAIGEELFQEKYTLETKVLVEFWSNTAQLQQKTKQARRAAKAYLFRDMLPLVEEILMHSESEDVHLAASELRSLMLEDQYDE